MASKDHCLQLCIFVKLCNFSKTEKSCDVELDRTANVTPNVTLILLVFLKTGSLLPFSDMGIVKS